MKKLPTINNLTIKHKLIALIGGQLLIFAIVLYAVFTSFQNILEQNVNALVQQTLNTVTSNVEVKLNQQMMLSNAIASDSQLIKLIRTFSNQNESSSIWTQVEMLEKMKSYTTVTENQYSVGIYNINMGSILSTKDGSIPVSKQIKDWVKELDKNTATMGFYVNTNREFGEQQIEDASITLIRKMPGKLKDNYLIVSTSKQMLNQVIGKMELWQDTSILVTDSHNQVIYQGGKLNDSGDYIGSLQFSNMANWNIQMMIPKREIMEDVIRIKQLTLYFTAGIGLLLLMLSVWLYMQIINPIKRLVNSMVKVEKGFPHKPIEIKRYDELGFMQQRFNDMVSNELQMREQILQEQLHSKEIEFKFLQSQVNPHFLYNTLDSIYWASVENNADEISDVVLDLSRYFRLSLSRGKEFVTIRESVEHLDYYLRIQMFRHIEKFHVNWDIDETVEDYQIMKLMLQPIVENSIIHGMETMAEACQLSISIKKHHSRVVFTIEDTGIGMSLKKLRKLMFEIKRKEGPSKVTYGLRNLYQRLKLMYGADMYFSVSSIPKRGTRVKVAIHISRLKEGAGA